MTLDSRSETLEHSNESTHCALLLTKTQIFDPKPCRIPRMWGRSLWGAAGALPVPGLTGASPDLSYSDAGTLIPFPVHTRNAFD